MPDPSVGRTERSTSEREDAALEAFRKAAHNLLMLGFDADLLAQEIAEIWRREFEGDDDDD